MSRSQAHRARTLVALFTHHRQDKPYQAERQLLSALRNKERVARHLDAAKRHLKQAVGTAAEVC